MPITNIQYGEGTPGEQPDNTTQSLYQRGPVLPVEVAITDDLAQQLQEEEQEIPAPQTGYALIDTGATRTAVDQEVVESLDLEPIDTARVGTAGGVEERGVYATQMSFPGTPIRDLEGHLLGVDLSGQVLGQIVADHTEADDQDLEPEEGNLIALVGRDL